MDPDRLIRWLHDHDVTVFAIGLALLLAVTILGF